MSITTISLILSALAAIVLAIIAIIQLKNMIKQNRDIHEWNRRKATFDMAMSIVEGEKYSSIRSALLGLGFDIDDQSHTYNEIHASLNKEDQKKAQLLLSRMFNMFEDLCVALKHKLVDELIAKDLLMLYFMVNYRKYKSFLMEFNQLESRPGAFCEFLICVKEWESEYKQEIKAQEGIRVYRGSREGKSPLGQ